MTISNIDIHGRKKRIDSLMSRIDISEILERNKRLIYDYKTNNESEGLSISRVERNIQSLLHLSRFIENEQEV